MSSMERVSNFLEENGLGAYAATFEQEGYDDLDLLAELDEVSIVAPVSSLPVSDVPVALNRGYCIVRCSWSWRSWSRWPR